jgi:hypothetical protein
MIMKLKHIFYLGFAVSMAFWMIGVHADNQTNDMDDTLVLLRHGNVTVTEGDLRTELQKLPEAERNFFFNGSQKNPAATFQSVCPCGTGSRSQGGGP